MSSMRTKQPEPTSPSSTHDPVLTPEDEAFFRQVMARDGGGAAESDDISNAFVPTTATTATTTGKQDGSIEKAEEIGKELGEERRRESASKEKKGGEGEKKKKRWSLNWPWRKEKKPSGSRANEFSEPANDANSTSESSDATKDTKDKEPQRETQPNADNAEDNDTDMAEILDQLNLAAENNRVFSASDEMQELLRKFKLIFKDLINGVPTAYHDLEMLLKNGNKQLQDTYTRLPGFLQKLIEKLPEKWTDSLAPEVLAAASERAARSGVNTEGVGKAAAAANKMGFQVPGLKELVGKPAAIVGMLRSIVAFLKARFPAVVGVNILWSLALSILLFVLWYCHKRGREVRLENERIVTEQEIAKMNEEAASEERPIRATETLTTTAPRGAPADAIRDGVRAVEQARETTRIETTTTGDFGEAAENTTTSIATHANQDENVNPAPVPARSKSKLSLFSRKSKTEPYPGT